MITLTVKVEIDAKVAIKLMSFMIVVAKIVLLLL